MARLDKDTFCQRETVTTHVSLVLIDVTDPLPMTEIDGLKDRARKLAAEMEDYGLLIVAVLNSGDAMSPRIVFRRCAPRSPTRT